MGEWIRIDLKFRIQENPTQVINPRSEWFESKVSDWFPGDLQSTRLNIFSELIRKTFWIYFDDNRLKTRPIQWEGSTWINQAKFSIRMNSNRSKLELILTKFSIKIDPSEFEVGKIQIFFGLKILFKSIQAWIKFQSKMFTRETNII